MGTDHSSQSVPSVYDRQRYSFKGSSFPEVTAASHERTKRISRRKLLRSPFVIRWSWRAASELQELSETLTASRRRSWPCRCRAVQQRKVGSKCRFPCSYTEQTGASLCHTRQELLGAEQVSQNKKPHFWPCRRLSLRIRLKDRLVRQVSVVAWTQVLE